MRRVFPTEVKKTFSDVLIGIGWNRLLATSSSLLFLLLLFRVAELQLEDGIPLFALNRFRVQNVLESYERTRGRRRNTSFLGTLSLSHPIASATRARKKAEERFFIKAVQIS